MDDHYEENRIQLYAAVNLKRKHLAIEEYVRRFVLLKLTTDRHEATRGLSVTAELLVSYLASDSYKTCMFQRDRYGVLPWCDGVASRPTFDCHAAERL